MSNSQNSWMVSNQICVDLKLDEKNNVKVLKASTTDSIFAETANLPAGVNLVRNARTLALKGRPTKQGVYIVNLDIYEAWPGIINKKLVLSISVI